MIRQHEVRRRREHLPLTTGRVGLSQTTNRIEFYDGQLWPGVANRVRTGQLRIAPPWPPVWAPPFFKPAPWAQLGCTGSQLFAALVVDRRWLLG
jgi:hypothetical protein